MLPLDTLGIFEWTCRTALQFEWGGVACSGTSLHKSKVVEAVALFNNGPTSSSHMWSTNRSISCTQSEFGPFSGKTDKIPQWIVGPHGVHKPVCGPHVNRLLLWDDEVGSLSEYAVADCVLCTQRLLTGHCVLCCIVCTHSPGYDDRCMFRSAVHQGQFIENCTSCFPWFPRSTGTCSISKAGSFKNVFSLFPVFANYPLSKLPAPLPALRILQVMHLVHEGIRDFEGG